MHQYNSIFNSNLNNSYTPIPIYNYQITDTTYYPIQPISNSLILPKIQIGKAIPTQKNNNCNNCNSCNNCCLNIKDILFLFSQLPKKEENKKIEYINQPPIREFELNPPNPKIPIINKEKEKENSPFPILPKKIPIESIIETPKHYRKIRPKSSKRFRETRKKSKDWWRLAWNFFNLFVFIRTAIKYSRNGKKRDKIIKEREKNVGDELFTLKNWIISIEQPFWNEFKVFKHLNLSYKNSNSKKKIEKETQKIKAIIQKFIENLINKTQKLSEIPKSIQQIIYNFIKERAYFPKEFFSTYQIYRLDFHFYGGTRMINEEEESMILSLLLINGIVVKQILYHIGENFVEFKNLKEIDLSAKYIGSIIYYLTRETFKGQPKIHKIFEAILNYYRNYDLDNKDLDSCEDIFGDDMVYKDKDEFIVNLIPYSDISKFWDLNKDFVENYKKFIYGWAVNLCNLIKKKYAKKDPDLKPRKKLKKPNYHKGF